MTTNALTANRFLEIPATMIREVATGLEEGKDIAVRYGYSESEWKDIETLPTFINEVNKVRSEMERSGLTFKIKASVMADSLLDNMYAHAMQADVPLKDKAAALTILTRVADLEPKNNTQVQAGPGFSITISIPPMPVEGKPKDVVEGTIDDTPEELTLNFAPTQPTPTQVAPEIEIPEEEESEDND